MQESFKGNKKLRNKEIQHWQVINLKKGKHKMW